MAHTENENFNWSCKRYQSGYNGSMYFCCGHTNKEAQGCVVSRHREKTAEDLHENPEWLPGILSCN